MFTDCYYLHLIQLLLFTLRRTDKCGVNYSVKHHLKLGLCFLLPNKFFPSRCFTPIKLIIFSEWMLGRGQAQLSEVLQD